MILGNAEFRVRLFLFRAQLIRSRHKLSTYVHVGKARGRCAWMHKFRECRMHKNGRAWPPPQTETS